MNDLTIDCFSLFVIHCSLFAFFTRLRHLTPDEILALNNDKIIEIRNIPDLHQLVYSDQIEPIFEISPSTMRAVIVKVIFPSGNFRWIKNEKQFHHLSNIPEQ